jgi:hypothetical protein
VRILLTVLIAGALTVLAPQARAQDGTEAARAALAERLIVATVRDSIDKVVEDTIERMLADSEVTDEQAEWQRTNMPAIMGRRLETMIDQTEALYAERFTEQELRALVEFYETPEGRAISLKQNEVSALMGQSVMTFMQAFVADYIAKYCAAFTCPAQSPDAAGRAKH